MMISFVHTYYVNTLVKHISKCKWPPS